MEVVLFSTGCPKCKVLETKLGSAGISYTSVTDVDEIMEHGYTSVPVLVVDDNSMEFSDAVKWVNDYVNNH